MLKKHVRRVLLPLLFSFCCVFSGFLSVNVYAYSATYPQYNYSLANIGVRFLNSDGTYSSVGFPSRVDTVQDVYSINYSHISVMDEYLFYSNAASPNNATWVIPYLPDYDYYFLANYYFEDQTLDFNISDFKLYYSIDSTVYEHTISNVNIIPYSIDSRHGYTMMCKIDSFSTDAGLYSHQMFFADDFSVINKLQFYTASVFVVPKGDAEAINNLVAAINEQTSSLGGKLDSIDQSIEDQYSGDPEEEFNIDDVMTEHTEKMGVLSFGSDVMVQFLDMFQSANAGTAELTLPGFNITVQNVEYQVWPDYSFDFNLIDEWVPGLMSVIRVILPAFVWIKVLNYCIIVFEKNFLANNGG